MGNISLMKKTLEFIKLNPEKHKQAGWIGFSDEVWDNYEYNACHTTLCTAGHAAVLAGAEVPTFGVLEENGWYLNEDGKLDWNGLHVSDWASAKLGMTSLEYNYIFLCLDDAIALRRIEQVIALWEECKRLDDIPESEYIGTAED